MNQDGKMCITSQIALKWPEKLLERRTPCPCGRCGGRQKEMGASPDQNHQPTFLEI